MSNKKKELVCFGEVLWDIYIEGKKLGGAPFNVAAHLKKLGGCKLGAYVATQHGALPKHPKI